MRAYHDPPLPSALGKGVKHQYQSPLPPTGAHIFADTLFLSLFSLIIQKIFLILHTEIKTF